jgi:hypothetical protein
MTRTEHHVKAARFAAHIYTTIADKHHADLELVRYCKQLGQPNLPQGEWVAYIKQLISTGASKSRPVQYTKIIQVPITEQKYQELMDNKPSGMSLAAYVRSML